MFLTGRSGDCSSVNAYINRSQPSAELTPSHARLIEAWNRGSLVQIQDCAATVMERKLRVRIPDLSVLNELVP